MDVAGTISSGFFTVADDDDDNSLKIYDSDDSDDDLSDQQTIQSDQSLGLGAKDSVVLWRVVVVSLLLVNGALSGITYLWDLITRDYVLQQKFYASADRIMKKSLKRTEDLAAELNAISSDINSRVLYEELNWPYVSHGHFRLLSENLLNETGYQAVALTPLITEHTRSEWEAYSIDNQEWILKSFPNLDASNVSEIYPQIFRRRFDGQPFFEYGPGPYLPLWQCSKALHTPIDPSIVNFNLLSVPAFASAFKGVVERRQYVLSEVLDVSHLVFGGIATVENSDAQSVIIQPIFSSFDPDSDVVAAVVGVMPWNIIFDDMHLEGEKGIVCVVKSSCGSTFSYRIDRGNSVFLGMVDGHSDIYDYMVQKYDLNLLSSGITAPDGTNCSTTLYIYPTNLFYEVHATREPAKFAGILVGIFFFTCLVFRGYEYIASLKEKNLHREVLKSNKIINKLYPQQVRNQILEEAEGLKNSGKKGFMTDKELLDTFLSDDPSAVCDPTNKPIATLFPEATIMYADIAGFTAWSSVRQPEHVFILLEGIFSSFDGLAKRRGVFKVETIGDCYVAVTGLPRPRVDHAIMMAKFAQDCMEVLPEIISGLEQRLGPGTDQLAMRIGLHSGPVTAGVLRGERSRFQLFGETVDITARIESSGERSKIHISQETADELIAAGKSSWIQMRQNKIQLRGNEAQTYWIVLKNQLPARSRSCMSSDYSESEPETDLGADDMNATNHSRVAVQIDRLVQWNADVLGRHLGNIVSGRRLRKPQHISEEALEELENNLTKKSMKSEKVSDTVILLPQGKRGSSVRFDDMPSSLSSVVLEQLHQYVSLIAGKHQQNEFHGFEHASHVAMSINKLLVRVGPSDTDEYDFRHDKTYIVMSHPLTRFALVFSALIHDMNHDGTPKAQQLSRGKNLNTSSYAAYNKAWKLLMEDQFKELRRCVYTSEDELRHFRQVIACTAMSTDLFWKEEKPVRQERWERALSSEQEGTEKIAVVIEHLFLASYYAHTMQHWLVYINWKERLFRETYAAFKQGRWDDDPTVDWYARELTFFDDFIIPLATNMAESGVFGISPDEYKICAEANRKELAVKGDDIIQSIVEDILKSSAIEEEEETDSFN